MLISAFGWYGGLIGGGMVICIVLAYFMAKWRGYDPDNVFNVALVCIPLAIIGARTYYVVTEIIGGTPWTFTEFLGFENGQFVGLAGLAIYGGLLGAIIGAFIIRLFNRKKPIEKQMTLVQMADMYFCLIILGQAIGRWGNFANGEVYGKLITDPAWQWFPFAVKIGSSYHYATFFYESMWNLLGFGLLQWFYNGKRKSFDGFCIAFYCMWYGFIRFVLEGLREEEFIMKFGSLKANELISFILFLIGAAIMITHLVMAKRAGKKPLLFVKEEEMGPEYYGYEKTIFYLKTTFPQKDETEKKETGLFGSRRKPDTQEETTDESYAQDEAQIDEQTESEAESEDKE